MSNPGATNHTQFAASSGLTQAEWEEGKAAALCCVGTDGLTGVKLEEALWRIVKYHQARTKVAEEACDQAVREEDKARMRWYEVWMSLQPQERVEAATASVLAMQEAANKVLEEKASSEELVQTLVKLGQ